MPCKHGFREQLEQSKREREEREKHIPTPQEKYWTWLVREIYSNPSRRSQLSRESLLYFAAAIVDGEVYNGGFHQYFYNSGDYYLDSMEGLAAIDAPRHRELLQQAKTCIFGDIEMPRDLHSCRVLLWGRVFDEKQLDELDKAFHAENLTSVFELLAQYGEYHHLFQCP